VADIETFRMIHHLVKVKGYTIQGAKDKLRSGKDDAAKEAQMIQSLTRVREFLVELRKQLQAPNSQDPTSSHET
jgi:hypothetical protein